MFRRSTPHQCSLVHIYTCSCITLINVNLLSPSARGTRQHNQHMRTCRHADMRPHKPLSFEFGVIGKIVVRYFLFRIKIVAFSSEFAMWHSTNTIIRLLNFSAKYYVRRRGVLKSATKQTRQAFVAYMYL